MSTNITEEERGSYDTVVSKFEDFFKVRRNVIFERARFNRCNQLEGETAEKYIMELYALAENCNYGNMKEMIHDRLVVVIRDTALSQKLQLDADLTLEKAKRNICQREAVSEQQRILGAPEEMCVDQLRYRNRKYLPRGKRPQTHAHHACRPDVPIRTKTAGSERTGKTCSRCGRGSHPRDKCPAKDAVCHKCDKKGHYSSQCFSKKVSEVTGANESQLNTAFLDTVTANLSSAWFATIGMNEHSITVKLDTGAEVTAISTDTYKSLRKPRLSPQKKLLYGPSRQPLDTAGEFQAEITYKDEREQQLVYVVISLKTNLLGLPAITALGLAARVDATIEANPKTEILAKFPGVFQGLGNLGEEYEIYLKPDARPYSLFTPRHVPHHYARRSEKNSTEWNRSELSPKLTSVLRGVPGCLWYQRRKEPFVSVST